MKSMMLAGVALLSFTAVAAGAQDVPSAPTAQPPGTETPPPADNMSPPPGAATSATSPRPGTDPNAVQPMGEVPPTTGMVPASPDAPRDPAAPVGSPTNPVQVGGNVTPPPTDTKDYPLCSRTVQDSCINPSEAKGRKRR